MKRQSEYTYEKGVPPWLYIRGVNTQWRSRVAGRARTIGNRVTVNSGSRVRIPPSPPSRGYKIDVAGENPDKIGVFTVYTAKFPQTVLTDIKMMFSLCWMSCTLTQPNNDTQGR